MNQSSYPPAPQTLPRFAGVAIFILALAALALEVALTRVFSVMTFHHSVYLIIGLALLGFGAAGAVLATNERFRGDAVKPGLLADCAWLFALAIIISFLGATKTLFDAEAIATHKDYSQFFAMLLLLVWAALPFFFGGLCIGYLVSKAGGEINRIYFADLCGAGCGALGILMGINYLGVPTSIFLIAAAVSGVAILLGGVDGPFRWRYPLTLLLSAGLAAATLARDAAVPVPIPPSKIADYRGEEYKWNVIARVDVVGPEVSYPNFSGALSRAYTADKPPLAHMKIYQDGQAFTGMVKLEDTTPKDLEILGYYLQGIGYVLRPDPKVLVIGPGGGIDVAIALHHGASHVTGIEINPRTIEYVKGKFAQFSGNLYNRSDVDLVNAEGRHFLTATDAKFDVIQLSGVDTFTALSSGATALSETYLYTIEAVDEFLRHLNTGGVLSFSRWLFTPDRETLRLAITAREALQRRGVTNPEQCILIFAAPAWNDRSPWSETLIKNEPFTREEVAKLRDWAAAKKFDVIYDPYVPHVAGGEYDKLESTSKYEPAKIAPTFSSALRMSNAELATFIHDYPFNVKPCPDDAPFFFDYYGFKNLRNPFSTGKGGFPVTRLPLAHIFMPACLLAVTLLGGAFILRPLRSQAAGLRNQPGRRRVLLYFAAIGLAFIAVEVMVLQKLMVFLGGPVYSMAITLFSILIFCGIGSFVAKRFTERNPRAGGAAILALLCAAIFGTTWFLNHQLNGLMWMNHTLRCVAAAGLLLPIGLLMGMPFPTGIRMAERINPRLIPLAWSANAFATVFGSIGCIFAALSSSFTTVIYVGLVIYAVALVALLALPGQARTGGAATRSGIE